VPFSKILVRNLDI